ncbi:MAG: sialidase family protein [Planctomycetota bacterium]|nr:sialidase family protein [Planctomycetota bacterium]
MLAISEPKQLLQQLTVLQACAFLSCIFPTTAFSQEGDSSLPEPAKPGQGALKTSAFIYDVADRPTPSCHASTIVETPSGLVAAWFGGKHEKNPDVGIWLSRNPGNGWSKPVQIVDGSENEEQEYACWNPVLFRTASGKLLLFYKVGLNPRLWWGALVSSDDDGVTWSTSRRLGTSQKLFKANKNLIGPVKNKPIQLRDGTLLCPSSTENEGWRIHFEVSKDAGKSWKVIGPLLEGEKLDAIQPSVLTYKDGRMQIICRTQQGVLGTAWSPDGGKTWGEMKSTKLPNPNAGTDAVTLQDGRQLLVYNHSTRQPGRNGREVLNVAISADGVGWKRVMTLEMVGGRAEFSYPAVIQSKDGLVHITYTWQRQSIKHAVLDPSKL